MTTRILPIDEWPKLAATGEVGELWRFLPPTAKPIVVEDGETIIGVHVILPVWHLEGLWIAEDHRGKGSVARHLWGRVKRELKEMGVPRVLTAANDDRVHGLLAHVDATPLPDHYLVELD